ncbi:MAG: hypothetical protein EXQ99_03945 [Alphaproteobacteria bacterium]|nr:hypothetical protein [Alphaproteobacteria bacterium]
MIDARKILENENIKKDFPVLNLYCNWIVHSIINRHTNMLCDITESLLKHWENTVSSDISAEISKLLNLKTLRKELICLMEKYGIGVEQIRDNAIWDFLRENIIKELLYSPIYLNYDKSKGDCIFDEGGITNYGKICKLLHVDAPFRVVRFFLSEDPKNGKSIIKWNARIESLKTITSRDAYKSLVGNIVI